MTHNSVFVFFTIPFIEKGIFTVWLFNEGSSTHDFNIGTFYLRGTVTFSPYLIKIIKLNWHVVNIQKLNLLIE